MCENCIRREGYYQGLTECANIVISEIEKMEESGLADTDEYKGAKAMLDAIEKKLEEINREVQKKVFEKLINMVIPFDPVIKPTDGDFN